MTATAPVHRPAMEPREDKPRETVVPIPSSIAPSKPIPTEQAIPIPTAVAPARRGRRW